MDSGWLAREYARATERSSAVPAHARPVLTRGSLTMEHNHLRYDIQPSGICPACDDYRARRKAMKQAEVTDAVLSQIGDMRTRLNGVFDALEGLVKNAEKKAPVE